MTHSVTYVGIELVWQLKSQQNFFPDLPFFYLPASDAVAIPLLVDISQNAILQLLYKLCFLFNLGMQVDTRI